MIFLHKHPAFPVHTILTGQFGNIWGEKAFGGNKTKVANFYREKASTRLLAVGFVRVFMRKSIDLSSKTKKSRLKPQGG